MLQRALEAKGLEREVVDADGNCLFSTFALELHGDESKHIKVRRDYIAGLEADPARFLERIRHHYNGLGGQHKFDTTEAFVAHMRRDRVWGDELDVTFMLEIFPKLDRAIIYCPDVDGNLVTAFSFGKQSGRTIGLVFIGNSHYDRVQPLRVAAGAGVRTYLRGKGQGGVLGGRPGGRGRREGGWGGAGGGLQVRERKGDG